MISRITTFLPFATLAFLFVMVFPSIAWASYDDSAGLIDVVFSTNVNSSELEKDSLSVDVQQDIIESSAVQDDSDDNGYDIDTLKLNPPAEFTDSEIGGSTVMSKDAVDLMSLGLTTNDKEADDIEKGSQLLEASSTSVLVTPATQSELDSSLPSVEEAGVVMYRLYNRFTGEHLYTASENERDVLSGIGWTYEGIGWIAPSSGNPVFRLYNPYSSDHHYTMEVHEREVLKGIGWIYEGIGWFSGGTQALLRQFNPNEKIGTHNYTCSQNENDSLVRVGWRGEGVGWYALADSKDSFREVVKNTKVGILGRISSCEKDVHVSSNYVDDTYYLMLPSFADLSSVRLSGVFKGAEISLLLAASSSGVYSTIQAGETVDVAALSKTITDGGARLLWFKTAATPTAQRLAVMVSANISSMYINSAYFEKNREYIEASADHSAKADVCIAVIDKDGATIYDKDSAKSYSTIKGRGNSTWNIGDKRPYQISLSKKADLLNTENSANKQKKWILLANANDATLLHNTIAYNMALELGMVGTECEPVDLYYDGQYRGSYLLCEKIQIKEGRIDITDLEDAFEKANSGTDFESLPTVRATNSYGKTYQFVQGVVNPKDLTGGYLLEIDGAYYSRETCWFDSTWGYIVVKSPEYCSQAAMKYISEYVELAIRRYNSGQTTETSGDIQDGALIDLDSFAKTYIIGEYAKNIDTFLTSTYLYKDAGANPLYSQPVWDFDGSMGVRKENSSFTVYQGFSSPHAPYRGGCLSIMQERARNIWTNQLSPLINKVLLSASVSAAGPRGFLHSLVFYRQQIEASERMDEVLYGLTAFSNEITPYGSYELNYNYLCNWLTWRTAWMDDNIWRISGGSINNSPYTYNGVDYGLVFDASYYIEMNKGILGASISEAAALRHFVTVGMSLGLVASRNFNALAYKARYADLRQAYGNTLSSYYWHYMDNGFREGRNAL